MNSSFLMLVVAIIPALGDLASFHLDSPGLSIVTICRNVVHVTLGLAKTMYLFYELPSFFYT